MIKRLYLSKDDQKIFGVCGGIAKYFNIDSTIIRLLFLISFLFFLEIGIIYLVILVLTPHEENKDDNT